MHTYGSRRCGPAGSRGGKGRERISSPCTQSDEDSAPVGEQQLVKKSLAGFTCRSSEMTSARVPNAERLTTPARPGGRKRERKIGPASSALGQKLVLGHLKKETMVTVGPLPGALKPRLRYETSSNRRVVVSTTVAADSEGPAPHVSVRPVPARPTDIHPSVRPARNQSSRCCDPPPPLVPTFVRPAFVASVFDWFLNYLGCCALSLFCANYVTKP